MSMYQEIDGWRQAYWQSQDGNKQDTGSDGGGSVAGTNGSDRAGHGYMARYVIYTEQ